jgi:hypothetical protein
LWPLERTSASNMSKPTPEQLAERPHLALTYREPPEPPPTPPPRPPIKYTRGLHDQIVSLLQRGHRRMVAAKMAGIAPTTLEEWVRKGNEGDVFLWEFARDVGVAEAQAEDKALETVRGSTGAEFADADNAKWWLERARADGYSKEAATRVNAMLGEFFKRLEEGLPPVITQEMVGRSMFQIVLAAASGDSVDKVPLQLTDGEPEED